MDGYRIFVSIFFLTIALLFPIILRADIFKCASESGEIVYQDTPCVGQKSIVVDNSQSRKIHQLEQEKKKMDEKSKMEVDRLVRKDLTIGMSKHEILASPIWRHPYKTNRITTGYSTSEVLIYKTGTEYHYIYLYFEDDKLTAIQD